MKKFFGFFISRAFLGFLAFIALAALIWFGGPLIAIAGWYPLESAMVRLAIIGAMALIWLVRKLVGYLRGKQLNRKLVDALKGDGQAAPTESGEARAVRERFEMAMALMRTSSLKGGSKGGIWQRLQGRDPFVYELPWYMFIGPPGSGKTTALLNCGLRFPLAERLGGASLKGVGGTRNCDWWFADEAVLIDTAGRYTTQDSDEQGDAREWQAFVQSLKRFRPRQPINGVIVTVSVADLLAQRSMVTEQAAAVNARLRELHTTLGTSFPVYVLLTKGDLLAGFTEFFDGLDRQQRQQIWGMTFPFVEGQAEPYSAERYAGQFADLVERLEAMKLNRLQAERDLARRGAIFAFPQQVAAIGEALGEFMAHAFGESALTAAPVVRGVFLTSGTQEGSPMDRIMASLGRRFGVQQRVLPAAQGAGRAYFLTDLLKNLVFVEAPLAGNNLRWMRRMNLLRWGLASLAVGAALLLLVGQVTSYLNNRDYIGYVQASAQRLHDPIVEGKVASDPKSLLILLKAVRGLAVTEQVDPQEPRMAFRFGLFQGEKLDEASYQAYRKMSAQMLAPYLMSRIERTLRRGAPNPELHYEALKTYAMLISPEHLDPAAVKAWFDFDFEVNDDLTLDARERAEMLAHLHNLLQTDAFQAEAHADADLLARSRAILASTPFPKRVYDRLARQGVGRDIADFRIDQAGGPSAAVVFVRRDGKPLSEGMPGLFTHDGYHKAFSQALDGVIVDLAQEETWVLGVADSVNARLAANPVSRGQLVDQVKGLYLNDYANRWEQFIAQIGVVGGGSLTETIQTLQILSASTSPLVQLLEAIVKQVTLTRAPEGTVEKAVDKAGAALQSSREQLNKLLGQAGAKPVPAGAQRGIESIVDDRFTSLRRLVTAAVPGGPKPIDDALKTVDQVYQHLLTVKQALDQNLQPPASPIFLQARSQAARLAEPVRSMVLGLSAEGESAAGSGTRRILGQELRSEVGDVCQRALNGRYPFAAGSPVDMALGDLQQIFGQGGMMDQFFKERLAPLVDTTGRVWRFREAGTATPVQSGALRQFQRAAEIRRAMFGGPGGTFGSVVHLTVVEMDPAILQFSLDVDGQVISYQHGPQIPTQVRWPGPRGSNQVRLEVSPPSASGVSAMTFDGPWALNRLFDQGRQVGRASPDRFRLAFNFGGRQVVLDVRASSVTNPFNLGELRSFRCPGLL